MSDKTAFALQLVVGVDGISAVPARAKAPSTSAPRWADTPERDREAADRDHRPNGDPDNRRWAGAAGRSTRAKA